MGRSRFGFGRLGVFAILFALAYAPVSAAVDRSATYPRKSVDTLIQSPQSASHDGLFGHLPPVQENLEVVGQLEPTGAFGPIRPGQIADLAVHKGYAYLNSWDSPTCERGGTYVIDIRNPSRPREVGFIPAPYPYYHGEGAHVVSINTPAFRGDVLAVNDETYGSNIPADQFDCENPPATFQGGGFDLYDVSDPENPVPLVQGAGDRDPDNDPETEERDFANSYHSVFVWQNGPRAFLVASDNIEFTDVDIFDITNPRAPVQVGDHDLVELFPQILDGEEANGGSVFHHDVVVKQIGGRPVMKVDYWDAGYVQLDVSDPSNPEYITDTTFSGEDPLFPGSGLPPEGNAHQGEFSFDNQFLLAADEDFSPFRGIVRSTSGDTSGRTATAAEGDSNARIAELPDGRMNGPSMFVGDACSAASVPDAPADDGDPNTDDIALIERGTCFFSEKFDNAQAKGWDGVIIFNNERPDDNLVSMLTGPADIPGVHMRRVDALGPEGVLSTSSSTPPPGTPGPNLIVGGEFDGWGYAHLYDARTSEELDAFAITESLDERYANDFGDLSIHEFATDPTEHLAYSAYYSGGIRVLRFNRADGLSETGAWIGPDGSNFWGVEQLTTREGERLIAGSDRDFGLVILRYTGPGAARPPVCTDTTVLVPFKGSAEVPLTCSDANGNPLRESLTSRPENGTLSGDPDSGSVTYTHTGDRLGPADSFGFKANDGAADSNVATARLVAVARDGGRCSNPFVGSSSRDVIVGSPFGDRISGGRGRDTIGARAGDDCVSGGPSSDRVFGEAGSDRLSGDSGADRLFGGSGDDRLLGGAGNDGLAGRSGDDRLAGGRGPDRLNGGRGDDRLNAGGGTNRLSGGLGDDRLRARNGKVDKLRCGRGSDRVVADFEDEVMADCETVLRG